jgi:hypothetical protein
MQEIKDILIHIWIEENSHNIRYVLAIICICIFVHLLLTSRLVTTASVLSDLLFAALRLI